MLQLKVIDSKNSHCSWYSVTVGGYCEWMVNLSAGDKIYNCFEELQQDLTRRCNSQNPYTEFVFTPGNNLPNTIYYQVSIGLH